MIPLNVKTAHADLPIDVTPLTVEQVNMNIRQIKSGKLARQVKIPAEALTYTQLQGCSKFFEKIIGRKNKYRQIKKTVTPSRYQQRGSQQA